MDDGQALAEIEAALTSEDPRLAARLASFTWPVLSPRVAAMLTIALLAMLMFVAAFGGNGDDACRSPATQQPQTGASACGPSSTRLAARAGPPITGGG